MAQAINSSVGMTSVGTQSISQPSYQAFQILRTGFTVAPIVAGLDKFFHLLVNWDQYLPGFVNNMTGGHGHELMLAVGVIELAIRRFSPLLQRVLGLYVPLVATNCAVLGVALINTAASRSFVAALFYGTGAAIGFGLALTLFAALRERVALADVPVTFRGAPITFITAGILSLAFMAFAGFARL